MNRISKYFLILLFLSLITSCSSVVRFSSDSRNNSSKNSSGMTYKPDIYQYPEKITGKASYYSNEFEFRKTANGEIYSGSKFTAAHRDLPFGTYLRVTNEKNQKQVTVKVNDRGPFVSGRILDLSYSAAAALGMIQDGVADVEIEIIGQE